MTVESRAADEQSAASLVLRIGAGDRQAEEELVARYSRGVLLHLRQMSRDPAVSEDLHQETFRRVLERLRGRGLGEPEKLSGFILGTARNLYLTTRRNRRRHGEEQPSEEGPDPPDPAPDPLGKVLWEEEAELVHRLIAELGAERDRQVLLRFFVAEEDKERICDDLRLSSLHFNRVLFRARQRLKDLLFARRGSREVR